MEGRGTLETVQDPMPLSESELHEDLAASIEAMDVVERRARPSSGIYLRPRSSMSPSGSDPNLESLVKSHTESDPSNIADLGRVAEAVAETARPGSSLSVRRTTTVAALGARWAARSVLMST